MRAFLDTSSLIKLYFNEEGSSALRAQLQLGRDTLVVAELAWVEMPSAFQMKVRQRELTETEATQRLELFANDWPGFICISLTTVLLQQAANFTYKHRQLALRSLDAIQLAAALAAGPLDAFSTHDNRLRDAGLPVR